MVWWADYHSHSDVSIDCHYSLLQMTQGALAQGLRELAVTDHADFDPIDPGYEYYRYDGYLQQLAAARAALDGQLTIRCALELGYQPERHAEIITFLADKSYDFVLGSIHITEGLNVCDWPVWSAHVANRPPMTAYAPYFQDVATCAASGLVDVLSHLDLCKRYGVLTLGALSYADVSDLVDGALRAAVEHGVGIEINTSGLRQAPRATFPGLDILQRYAELGGEWITLGSDSHHPADLAAGFDVALEMTRRAGIR